MNFKVCRGCMTPDRDTKFMSIFRQKEKLAQLILELTNLKIPKLKKAPALLCAKCIKELKRAIFFRESIIKNHQNFSEFYSKNDPLTERLNAESEQNKSENLKIDEPEFFTPELPIDENELKDPKVQVTLIKEEPIDDEDFEVLANNSSSENDNEDSSSDEFPLILSIQNHKLNTEGKLNPQTSSFLCQRCGKIADRTCKFCKTKVIPKHEENKAKQRERIIHKYLENPTAKMSVLSRLAQAPRTTVRRTIESFKSNKKNERKAGSGRKIGTGNLDRETKIIEAVRLNPELSIRTLARMFGTCPSNVQKIKAKYGYICEKKMKRKKDVGEIGMNESENSGYELQYSG